METATPGEVRRNPPGPLTRPSRKPLIEASRNRSHLLHRSGLREGDRGESAATISGSPDSSGNIRVNDCRQESQKHAYAGDSIPGYSGQNASAISIPSNLPVLAVSAR